MLLITALEDETKCYFSKNGGPSSCFMESVNILLGILLVKLLWTFTCMMIKVSQLCPWESGFWSLSMGLSLSACTYVLMHVHAYTIVYVCALLSSRVHTHTFTWRLKDNFGCCSSGTDHRDYFKPHLVSNLQFLCVFSCF